jgi:hypothetical protein
MACDPVGLQPRARERRHCSGVDGPGCTAGARTPSPASEVASWLKCGAPAAAVLRGRRRERRQPHRQQHQRRQCLQHQCCLLHPRLHAAVGRLGRPRDADRAGHPLGPARPPGVVPSRQQAQLAGCCGPHRPRRGGCTQPAQWAGSGHSCRLQTVRHDRSRVAAGGTLWE